MVSSPLNFTISGVRGLGECIFLNDLRNCLCMHLVTWGSFHKAIIATVDLRYLQLILQLPALIFTVS